MQTQMCTTRGKDGLVNLDSLQLIMFRKGDSCIWQELRKQLMGHLAFLSSGAQVTNCLYTAKPIPFNNHQKKRIILFKYDLQKGEDRVLLVNMASVFNSTISKGY